MIGIRRKDPRPGTLGTGTLDRKQVGGRMSDKRQRLLDESVHLLQEYSDKMRRSIELELEACEALRESEKLEREAYAIEDSK